MRDGCYCPIIKGNALMQSRLILAAGVCLGVGACATPETVNNFTAERSVFANPYVAPEIDGHTGDGGLIYPGRGRFAFDQDGNRVELSRAERRTFRERTALIQEQAELNQLVAEFNARQAEMPPPPPIQLPAPIGNTNPSE